MAKMFSSLRLATMRSSSSSSNNHHHHQNKRQRPGSVATTASSDSSARTEETTTSTNHYNQHQHFHHHQSHRQSSSSSSSSSSPGLHLASSVQTGPSSSSNSSSAGSSASPTALFYANNNEDLALRGYGEFVLPASCTITSKVAQVRLERESGSLGVTLRGGVSRALVVTSVKPDGPAAREGRVRPGDRLLAVDDAELRGLTLHEAQRALRLSADCSPIASLTIEYDVANMDEVRTSTAGPLLVQLERGAHGELGIAVRENRSGVFVESLRPASTAERCGALQPGDRLLAVDEVPVHDATTAAQILRGSGPGCGRYARIQILPRPASCSARTLKRRAQPQAQKNSLYTKETLSVGLRPDHRGLGIGLKSEAEDCGDYLVDVIEPGGPAERSGVLLPGDRVVAINRRSIRGLQPDEVSAMLEMPKVELTIEYKIGGAVLPSSGVFTVRVARPPGAQPELGLIVNEDLVVAEVRRGSLAYRTGSLAPGDKLLAIDGQKLDSGDLRQAAQLLHRPGSSVVALTIRKPESGTDNRAASIPEETMETQHSALRCGRESLPSVDSAVDSWAEMVDNVGPDLMRLWETGSIDSGQLDLPIPPYSSSSSSPNDFSISEPRSQQIIHVSLHKDPVYEDFGFSVSDGLYERGVYINRLRPGGPCDGVLRPFDRILRVNETSTEDCDCCLAVPLIASAGARLDLMIARPINPENMMKNF